MNKYEAAMHLETLINEIIKDINARIYEKRNCYIKINSITQMNGIPDDDKKMQDANELYGGLIQNAVDEIKAKLNLFFQYERELSSLKEIMTNRGSFVKYVLDFINKMLAEIDLEPDHKKALAELKEQYERELIDIFSLENKENNNLGAK